MNVRSGKRKAACLFFAGWVVGALSGGGVIDALAQQGVPLPGRAIPQFVDPLPLLNVAPGGTIETITAASATLSMCEFKANVMPSTFVPAVGGPYTGTYVWGYRSGSACPGLAPALPTYTGPVFVATRGIPTEITYVNSLPDTTASQLLAWRFSTDQTLHWADPLNNGANHCAHNLVANTPPVGVCAQNYAGPIPAVPHLHGGEVPPVLDGGPDAWFTNNGTKGHAYYSRGGPLANAAIYRYPNTQEAAPIWFHDHALGATRLNVYAGLAGGYAITDPSLTLPTGLHPVGLQQGAAGSIDFLIPLVIQDRMFDTNGQLFFPNIGLNPEHPFWIPEFVGDTIVVNGKVWPFLNVEARRYRFLLINGSNARTYELSGPTMWQIATDGGYLDAPVRMTRLVLMPGERADVIIDFAGLTGKTLVLKNTGRTPFPIGAPPNGATVGRIVQFRVGPSTLGVDASYNPALRLPLRSPMPRLANPVTGTLNIAAAKTRLLTLNEVLGPLGPLEVLVNNTKYDGSPATNGTCRAGFTAVQVGTGPTECFSEVPAEGDTEVWEIVNLTADAHPIHTHLTQVQLINRQNINVNAYNKAYAAAFPASGPLCPAGVYCPGSGPPLTYGPTPASALKFGGNPNVQPYLLRGALPPNANEAGWKDTIMMLPGQVTRIAVRYAPTDTVAGAPGFYPFDPSAGGHGFVWHCHIIDHEDNEMMRPLMVTTNTATTRSYVLGSHY
jgi:FtsP/CotA-like multicopper oxidase with cupredoxin domain